MVLIRALDLLLAEVSFTTVFWSYWNLMVFNGAMDLLAYVTFTPVYNDPILGSLMVLLSV